MKRSVIALFTGLLAMALFTGCVLNFGGGRKTSTTCSEEHPVVGQQTVAPTLGQQLIDLQKAKEAGAITEQEYQNQRTRLLESK
jgi:hypothetical protein